MPSNGSSTLGYYDFGPLVSPERAVAVVGFMGSEAHKIANLMATLQGLTYHEIDRLVEHEVGLSRHEFVLRFGIDELRRVEHVQLKRALNDQPYGVCALGDGALLLEDSRRLVATKATLVYVERPAEVLMANIAERRRQAEPGMAERMPDPAQHRDQLERLFAAREEGYLDADHVVPAGEDHHREVAVAIMRRLGWPLIGA